MTSQYLQSPFPYFGGKSRAADLIWSRLGKVVNYIEPFFGSGAVLLQRPRPFEGVETVNDKEGMIANFFRALRDNPDELAAYADAPINECVPAGTMIATPEGFIPVELIRPGMMVIGERDGKPVVTEVLGTKKSSAKKFCQIGPLLVTDNHPIWTAEVGYLESAELSPGLHVAVLDYLINKIDLSMLYCDYGQSSLADLHTQRSSHRGDSLCRNNFSGQASFQRAHLAGGKRWKNLPGLLDTFADYEGGSSGILGYRNGSWVGMERRGKALDSALQRSLQFGEPDRWRGGTPWLLPNTRTPRQMVGDAQGSALCTRTKECDVRQEAFTGGDREDSGSKRGESNAGKHEAKNLCSKEGDQDTGTCYCSLGCSTEGKTSQRSAQKKDSGINQQSKACAMRGDWQDVSIYYSRSQMARGQEGAYLSSDSKGLPLQRLSLETPVNVYNFQTSTGNYFANNILVHNCDLHARHVYLVNDRERLTKRLEGDPEYYDVKIAGWWVWGIACWIGSGWCSGRGPWQSIPDAEGVRQLVHLGDSGQGVNRQRVHLGNSGQGVNRKLVHLGDSGQGVNRQRVHLGNSGQNGAYVRAELIHYFNELAYRLRDVRVCCGDFSRVLGPSVTFKHGLTGIFLDPPYSNDERAKGLYVEDCGSVAAKAREWAIANGQNELLRIAVAGYEEEHQFPDDWECAAWHAQGGYDGQNHDKEVIGKNRQRERIWFSPHCIKETLPLFAEVS